MAQDAYYAAMADKMERDPLSEDHGRATVPMGLGFKWRRFHKGEDTVWVENPEGQSYELTRVQADVYGLVTGWHGSYSGTVRALAILLKRSPSTVSRAVVKLASFGLIAVLTGRGRYGGILVSKRAMNDGLGRLREIAKAKVREWAKAAERRVSRLQANVAPYFLEKERGIDSLYWYLTSIPSTKTATLKDWTPQELREAGII